MAVRQRPGPADDRPDPAHILLNRRHSMLRSRTEAAIERIDQLLAVQGEN
jgi:hypothetical protein